MSDLSDLMALEAACWTPQTRADEAVVRNRIIRYREGQLVVDNGRCVVGVIYSQRIVSAEMLRGQSAATADTLHASQGRTIQLLALNVDSRYRDQQFGSRLLRAMLDRALADSSVDVMIGVTRCSGYQAKEGMSIAEYADRRDSEGWAFDPVLRLHQAHGARIGETVPDYRPADRVNEGYGVLVTYDLVRLRGTGTEIPNGLTSKVAALRLEAVTSFVEYCVRDIVRNRHGADAFSPDRPLMELGLDSADLFGLATRFSAKYGLDLSPTFFFSQNTPRKVADRLTELSQAAAVNLTSPEEGHAANAVSAPEASLSDIAVVGFAFRFPGGIETREALWDMLWSGQSAVGDMPQGRWCWPSDIPDRRNYPGIERGGFLRDLSSFDAKFFNISRREAELMDPQQRIMLELAWQCIEDAGHAADSLAGTQTGVFVGASGSDYERLLQERTSVEGHSALGSAMSIIANRISYFLGLEGPSLHVDTACSSSLVAVCQAIDAIRMGACRQALAGGINVICHPAASLSYWQAGMLSRDGRCKTFDQSADGYVRGEGGAFLLLKRLEDAMVDGDTIHAILKAGVVNHGGAAGGLTVPNPDSQARLIERAYDKLGKYTVGYIEAHGTGTRLGDPAEVDGLVKGFQLLDAKHGLTRREPCGLGSIKSNIGHLEAAAGVAGLLKVILCLGHRLLPPTLHVQATNPQIRFAGSPFFLVTAPREWPENGNEALVAGVSSFGSGGTNAHVVVQEYQSHGRDRDEAGDNDTLLILVLSARDEKALRGRARDTIAFLESAEGDLQDVVFTLQSGRVAMNHRLALVFLHRRDAVAGLKAFLDEKTFDGLFTGIAGHAGGRAAKPTPAPQHIMAASWVKGEAVAWKRSRKCQRVPLPGYPFARDRFWIEPKTASIAEPSPPNLDAALSRRALLAPAWDMMEPESGQFLPRFEHAVLVVADGAQDHADIRQYYPAAHHLDITVERETDEWARAIAAFPLLDHVILLSPENEPVASATASLAADIWSTYRLIRALLDKDYGTRVLSITIVTVQAVGRNAADPVNARHAGIQGLAATLAHEYPHWNVRVVDIDGYASWPLHSVLSLPFHPDASPVLLRNGHLYARSFITCSFPEPRAEICRQGGVYFIIGGTGGVGGVFSEYLARRYQAKLVWVGRRPLDDAIKRKMAAISELGVPEPVYVQADATKVPAIRDAIALAIQNFGRVDGFVNSTLTLRDKSFQNMTDEDFGPVLEGKIGTATALMEALGEIRPDFVLFFSSILSFLGLPGQANYAAGCAFTDAFAWQMSQTRPFPVKTVNWGYWGEVGAVATAAYRARLAKSGVCSIEARTAMEALERLLGGPVVQAAHLCVTGDKMPAGMPLSPEKLTEAASAAPSKRDMPASFAAAPAIREDDAAPALMEAFDRSVCDWLYARLCDWFSATPDIAFTPGGAASPALDRWLEESVRQLADRGYFHSDGLAITPKKRIPAEKAEADFADGRQVWLSCDATSPHTVPAETVLRHLPEILSGKKLATEVLFPGSSLELVRDIYRRDPVFLHFSEHAAFSLLAYVRDRVKADPLVKLRFLELGAGTGETTGLVLSAISAFADNIECYVFSDVSDVFLTSARERYRDHAFIRYSFCDLERPLAAQGLTPGSFDAVLCANVVHAVRRADKALRLIKSALKRNGLLVMVELSARSLSNHLVFGLLDGWWRAEDRSLRLEGSPVIPLQTWRALLRDEGFEEISLPAAASTGLGQQVIVAQSDGMIRLGNEDAGALRGRERISGTDRPVPAQTRIDGVLLNIIGTHLKTPANEIDPDLAFVEYGLDSIAGIQVIGSINAKLSTDLSTVALYSHSTINRLADYIAQKYPWLSNPASGEAEESSTRSAEVGSRIDDREPLIAVIGMSGRFGRARNVGEFWDVLAGGQDLTSAVTRWNLEEETGVPGTIACRRGSFLDDIADFDAFFFNISAAEANNMDPQQRIFLEECWKALEDAGYAGHAVQRMQCGVYAGHTGGDYHKLLPALPLPQAMWGNAASILSGRVAYCLDLRGPAITIDTACSSSLVSIHLACQALKSREIDIALAGGVFVMSTPDFYVSASRAEMLSPTGRCHTFDDRADGFVPGEGAGVLVLKRLEDAIADGDHIYGTIRGSAMAQDGATNGITAPSAASQEALEAGLYRKCGIDPRSIQLVEAHGTGTRLGDPIEFHALTQAFRESTQAKGFCAIGSVKTNVGHTTAAAGVCATIKVLLSLKNVQIPPTLNFISGNREINFSDSPFFVNTDLRAWPAPARDRRLAAISSFGFSGTNAHILVEEPPLLDRTHEDEKTYPVFLSAKRYGDVVRLARALLDHLRENPGTDLGNLSYTLLCGRGHFVFRAASIVRSTSELEALLSTWCSTDPKGGDFFSQIPKMDRDRLADLDHELDATIGECLKAGRLARANWLKTIMSIFMAGSSGSFERLFTSGYSRLSLPTYPFARERHWVSGAMPTLPVLLKPADEPGRIRDDLVILEEHWQAEAICSRRDGPKSIALFCLDDAFRKPIADAFKALDSEVRIAFVSPGPVYAWQSVTEYQVPPDDPSAYKRVLDDIRRQFGAVDAVLYYWALQDNRYIEQTQLVAHLVAGIWALKTTANLLLCAEFHDRISRCHIESWIGFSRTMNQSDDGPRVAVLHRPRAFDGSPDENGSVRQAKEWADLAWRTLREPVPESCLYREGVRYVLQARPVSLSPLAGGLKRGGVYVITGGLGGLGTILATHLAQTHHANLVLCGRSSPGPVVAEKLRVLRRFGTEIVYVQADIEDISEMRNALVLAHESVGRIDGVFHLAGVDGRDADIAEVLAPKIGGSLVLETAFMPDPPDFICHFSSIAAASGDLSNGCYAAANRFQQCLARYPDTTRKVGPRIVAIGWPLWHGGGMSFDPAQLEFFRKSTQLQPLSPEDGLGVLERVMISSVSAPLIYQGNRAHMLKVLGGREQRTGERDATQSVSTRTGQSNVDQEKLTGQLRCLASEILGVEPHRIPIDESLADLGFDSIGLRQFARRLGELLSQPLSPTIFFNYPTLGRLTRHLAMTYSRVLPVVEADAGRSEGRTEHDADTASEGDGGKPNVTRAPASEPEPIAIIGMAGRAPGVRSIDELWQVLSDGRTMVQEIPGDRFNWRQLPNDVCGKWLGAIPGVGEFDPEFFEISPAEATQMDPRQRLLLQETWKALEDAGIAPNEIRGRKVGVFVGAEHGDYEAIGTGEGMVTGNHDGILAARIAYFFDAHGPALVVNTACSSALVALHQACNSLRSAESEMAIVAGASLALTPHCHLALGGGGMLSPNGRCAAFSQEANGMVPGEAAIVLVLKSLSKALANGDPIHALIRASGIGHDGKTNGLTAPSGVSQLDLLNQVQETAKIQAHDIGYIIAHGTGTALGDPIEIEALDKCFSRNGAMPRSCAVTSVKGNVGHTLAASGLVSVAAMAQAMTHRAIPASLYCDTECEGIDWKSSALFINKQTCPWPDRSDHARMGCVSSFGMTGTNAHVIMEAWESAGPVPSFSSSFHVPILLSAHSTDALDEHIAGMREFLRQHEALQFPDLVCVSQTLMTGRQHFDHRCVLIVDSAARAGELLDSCREGGKSDDIFRGVATDRFRKQSESLLANLVKQASDQPHDTASFAEILRTLAQMHCQGFQIPWKHLFGGSSFRKMRLPTYRFSRKTYWIKASDTVMADKSDHIPQGEVNAKGPEPEIQNFLESLIRDKLGLDKLEAGKSLQSYGLDSIAGMSVIRRIEQEFGVSLRGRELLENNTLEKLAAYLRDRIARKSGTRSEYATGRLTAESDLLEQFRVGAIGIEEIERLLDLQDLREALAR